MRRVGLYPLLLLALAPLAVAACGGDDDDDEAIAQLQSIVSNLNTVVEGVETRLHDVDGGLAEAESGFGSIEEGINEFTASAAVHALDRTAGIADPPAGKVALKLGFPAVGAPLPGDGISVFETSPEVNTLWAMESLAQGQSLPVGAPVKDGTIFLAPGESRLVTVAYQNPIGDAVRFMAVPHQESPGSAVGKVWPTCLCFSFVYEAPENGSWYRVIRIRVAPDLAPGSKVAVDWSLLTDPSVFPAS